VSTHFVDRNRLWSRLDAAVAALPDPPPTPIAVVDLDAFDANAADLVRRAGGKPVRVASKSIRVPALISRKS
jgi:D-serine deaminase-like pyridoxal phosphate-dependent protein